MKLEQLPKTKLRNKKRIGRGQGSGKGKTGGKGQKGQKVRGKIKPTFEGGQLSLVHRLPVLRGRFKNKPVAKKVIEINLESLNNLAPNAVVDIEYLINSNMINSADVNKLGVKILGKGEIKIPLTIKLPISESAKEKIEKAGGKIETV